MKYENLAAAKKLCAQIKEYMDLLEKIEKDPGSVRFKLDTIPSKTDIISEHWNNKNWHMLRLYFRSQTSRLIAFLKTEIERLNAELDLL